MAMRLELTEESWKKFKLKVIKLFGSITEAQKEKKEEKPNYIKEKTPGFDEQVKLVAKYFQFCFDWALCLGFDESFLPDQILSIVQSKINTLSKWFSKKDIHYNLYLAPRDFPTFMAWCKTNLAFLNHSLIKGHVYPLIEFNEMKDWSKELEDDYSDVVSYWKNITRMRALKEWKEGAQVDYYSVRNNSELNAIQTKNKSQNAKKNNSKKNEEDSAVEIIPKIKDEFDEKYKKDIKAFKRWGKYKKIADKDQEIERHIEAEVIDKVFWMPKLSGTDRVYPKDPTEDHPKETIHVYFSHRSESFDVLNLVGKYADLMHRNRDLFLEMKFELEEKPELRLSPIVSSAEVKTNQGLESKPNSTVTNGELKTNPDRQLQPSTAVSIYVAKIWPENKNEAYEALRAYMEITLRQLRAQREKAEVKKVIELQKAIITQNKGTNPYAGTTNDIYQSKNPNLMHSNNGVINRNSHPNENYSPKPVRVKNG